MRLAVIPARGGSKRIPRKNIRDFLGKPMIIWSIEAARAAGIFERIIVSTDDDEIARVAKEAGVEVPFMRPAQIADDHCGVTEVIAHAVRWTLDAGWPLAAVCCIYPTAPMLTPEDLRRGLAALEAGDWRFALSVTEYGSTIFRALVRGSSGGIEMFFPENFTKRSQDLPIALHDAAQFCWGLPEAWIAGERIFAAHTIPVDIPRWRVQDIDTPDDWTRAEMLARCLRPDPENFG